MYLAISYDGTGARKIGIGVSQCESRDLNLWNEDNVTKKYQ